MRLPIPVGERRIVMQEYGNIVVYKQDFRRPNGEQIDTFRLYTAKPHPVLFLAVTKDLEVIAEGQYRHTVKHPIWEIPGGNPKGEQTPEQVIAAELLEETGYQYENLVLLGEHQLFEPASFDVEYSAYLALGCRKVQDPKPDSTESIEVELVPFRKWLEMIWSGEVVDDKSQAVTLLALPHLGVRFEYPTWLGGKI